MSKIFQGLDGCYYFLMEDGELSEPFEIKRRAIEALKLDDRWELDFGFAMDELEFWDEYYDGGF